MHSKATNLCALAHQTTCSVFMVKVYGLCNYSVRSETLLFEVASSALCSQQVV